MAGLFKCAVTEFHSFRLWRAALHNDFGVGVCLKDSIGQPHSDRGEEKDLMFGGFHSLKIGPF